MELNEITKFLTQLERNAKFPDDSKGIYTRIVGNMLVLTEVRQYEEQWGSFRTLIIEKVGLSFNLIIVEDDIYSFNKDAFFETGEDLLTYLSKLFLRPTYYYGWQ